MLARVAQKTTHVYEEASHPMTWASIDRSLCNSSLYPSTTRLTSTGSSPTTCGRASTRAVGGVVSGRSCNSWRIVGYQNTPINDQQIRGMGCKYLSRYGGMGGRDGGKLQQLENSRIPAKRTSINDQEFSGVGSSSLSDREGVG